MRRIAMLLLGLTLFLLPRPVMAATDLTGSELETLVAEAVEHNPEVVAGNAGWQMLVEKAKQAGSLDDPMLMLRIQSGMLSDPLAFDQDTQTAKVIGISQMLPLAGKRQLLRQGAEKEAEAARWSLEERKVELRKMVSETWAQLAYVETSLRLLDKNLALLADIEQLAAASYKSGMGKQADIVRVQIERSRMEEMKIGLEQQQRSLQAMFRALLHRDQSTEIAVPAGTIIAVTPTAAELEALAFTTRPELHARSARIAKAAAEERLAQREYYPDLTLSFEYMQRDAFMNEMASSDGADMYSAGITVNLPVQLAKRRAMVAETRQQRLMAEAEVDGLRHEIRRSIYDLLARLEASARMARLYREGVLPQDEFARESTLAAFRGGQIEFMSVLDSQMKLQADEQKAAMFVAEHQMLRAQLEATVGTRIE